MSPQQFLQLAPPTYYSEEVLQKLKQKMQKGEPLDALWLDVDVKTGRVLQHVGRHRAKVALELGIGFVPVVLYAKDGYDWAEATQLPEKLLPQKVK